MKTSLWLLWLVVSVAISGFYLYKILAAEDKSALLIGDASHGHFQIEMACQSCHTDAFGGQDALQEACVGCHAAELEEAHDSHPKKKFTDPRNADLVNVIDARYCISCHTEHQKEQTTAMGLTLPDDYCFHCHQGTVEERESHRDLSFDSCATAGCHNFHDNRALYEDFLVENAGGKWLKDNPGIAPATAAELSALATEDYQLLEFPAQSAAHADVLNEWLVSSHGQGGVNCGGCHSDTSEQWIEKPGVEQCATCHERESSTFLAGKHGMRLVAQLPPFEPQTSYLAFSPTAVAHSGCNQCHLPHSFDAADASTDACLQCHNDSHSLAFKDSPHGTLAARAANGEITADEVVSCATCHFPRLVDEKDGITFANHNQNDILRPNEKAIRPVCMQCHSLDFSIDALADPALIENNFSGKPVRHIPSIDWALKRAK